MMSGFLLGIVLSVCICLLLLYILTGHREETYSSAFAMDYN
jgi:hypothetical protein